MMFLGRLCGLIFAAVVCLSAVQYIFHLEDNAAAYSEHDPIVIDGDEGFIAENGVVSGEGTEQDPFVIERWSIAGTSALHGVSISNTQAHFVVRQVSITVSCGSYIHGIALSHVSNGSLEDCEVYSEGLAVSIGNSSRVAVRDCTLSCSNVTVWTLQATPGDTVIQVVFSEEVSMSGLTVRDTVRVGVDFVSSLECEVLDSLFASCMVGVRTYDSVVTYEENLMEDCLLVGFYLRLCQDSRISSNTLIRSGESGIRLEYCTNLTISGNLVMDSGIYGIIADTVPCSHYGNNDLNVTENTIRGSRTGILSVYTYGLSVSGNTIRDNYRGMSVYEGTSVIWHNDFLDNEFHASCNESIYGDDDNQWDAGYPVGGNYWSGYPGRDESQGPSQDEPGSDGIGDYPVMIGVNATDHYPLMTPCTEASEATPPLTVAEIVGTEGEDGWFVSEARVVLESSDDSAVLYTRFSLDSCEWQLFSGDLVVTEDGPHLLEYYAVDTSGNVEDIHLLEFRVDCTAPVLNLLTEDGTVFSSQSVAIAWTCSDSVSGIDRVEYSLDDGPFLLCEDAHGVNLSGVDDGVHLLTVRAYDGAGNQASVGISFEVETDAMSDPDKDPSSSETLDLLVVTVLVGIVAAASVVAAIVLRRRAGRNP